MDVFVRLNHLFLVTVKKGKEERVALRGDVFYFIITIIVIFLLPISLSFNSLYIYIYIYTVCLFYAVRLPCAPTVWKKRKESQWTKGGEEERYSCRFFC